SPSPCPSAPRTRRAAPARARRPTRPNATLAALLARLAPEHRARAPAAEDRTPVQGALQRVPQPRPVDRCRQVLRLAAGEEDHRGPLELAGVSLELGIHARLYGHEPRG